MWLSEHGRQEWLQTRRRRADARHAQTCSLILAKQSAGICLGSRLMSRQVGMCQGGLTHDSWCNSGSAVVCLGMPERAAAAEAC